MRYRRLEGRDEPIIEPDLAIIDAHHHLWLHPQLPYMPTELAEDASAGHKVIATVYVETLAFARQDGPEVMRPVGEVEFANGVGAMMAGGAFGHCRGCAAIVGHADLRHGSGVASLLERSMEAAPDRFRGIRQVTIEHPDKSIFRFMSKPPTSGILSHPNFRSGLAEVTARGLTFDASVFHHQLADIAALADAFPTLTIILDHMGIAVGIDRDPAGLREVFDEWRAALIDVGLRHNIVCKIGGLGLPYWGFGFDGRADDIGSDGLALAWRPFVETAISAFGPDRCMMESNYSADARSCGYVPLWNALKKCVGGASQTEKSALFRETAARIYRIDRRWLAPIATSARQS